MLLESLIERWSALGQTVPVDWTPPLLSRVSRRKGFLFNREWTNVSEFVFHHCHGSVSSSHNNLRLQRYPLQMWVQKELKRLSSSSKFTVGLIRSYYGFNHSSSLKVHCPTNPITNWSAGEGTEGGRVFIKCEWLATEMAEYLVHWAICNGRIT